ncbi:MAG TPA: hypothetical protein VK842_00660 [bacterium]|jgi:hypothetical protein|nr:hypothetical protein [bacterium]
MKTKTSSSSHTGLCDQCGRAIVLSKFTLCYECRHQEKLDADQALDYLKEHRGASLAEVAAATGVDAQLILRLIRGGRMEVMAKGKGKKK